jgi:hypothetical protein
LKYCLESSKKSAENVGLLVQEPINAVLEYKKYYIGFNWHVNMEYEYKADKRLLKL